MRPVFGFIAFVVIIIFLIVLIVRGGNDSGAPATPRPELASAAQTDATFTFTSAGPIVANEDFAQIRINVTRNSRSVQVYRGYNETLVASQHFDNNTEAFNQFLSALDRAGYTAERRTNLESEAGICPSGRRFVFESDQFGEDFRRWTTSCQENGNFAGSLNVVRQLYTSQIPEYNQFISGTRRETGLNL